MKSKNTGISEDAIIAQHLKDFSQSGLSQKSYSDLHGIHPRTFSRWVQRYKINKTVLKTGSFIPIQITESSLNIDTPIRVHFSPGVWVDLPGSTSLPYLFDLLKH